MTTERIFPHHDSVWMVCWPDRKGRGLIPILNTAECSKERAWKSYTDGQEAGEERGFVCRKFYLSLADPKKLAELVRDMVLAGAIEKEVWDSAGAVCRRANRHSTIGIDYWLEKPK